MRRFPRVLPTLAIAAVYLVAPGVKAAELDDLIANNRHELAYADGKLSGPGADWLLGQAANAQYFMFGEQHGTAEIAQMATALYRRLHPLGYDRAAIEVGPWSTPIAEGLLRDGDAFERYLAKGNQTLTFPFLFFQEEVAFARTVIELSGTTSGALWGVDQEFVAAALPMLDLLEGWARTPAEKQAVVDVKARAAQNPMLLGVGTDADWQPLIEAFAGAQQGAASNMIDEIVMSRRIYAPFTGRGGSVYTANEERERYMKTWFLKHLNESRVARGNTPKVFLKFGANHVTYGHSPTHVITLGTFVKELAWSEGQRTFNVHVDCKGGQTRDPRSGETPDCESYFLGADSSLGSFVHDDRITLIDLAALRAHSKLWADFDPKSKDLIWGYDAYIAIPRPKAAGVVGQ